MANSFGSLRKPSRGQHHHSESLGRILALEDFDSLHQDDVLDVCNEVGAALTEANARIRVACARGRQGNYMRGEEWTALQERRAWLATAHQRLQAIYRRTAKQDREAAPTAVPSLAEVFQQVVRNEASPTDYQRWVLQAEMRRSAEQVRANQKARAAANG